MFLRVEILNCSYAVVKSNSSEEAGRIEFAKQFLHPVCVLTFKMNAGILKNK